MDRYVTHDELKKYMDLLNNLIEKSFKTIQEIILLLEERISSLEKESFVKKDDLNNALNGAHQRIDKLKIYISLMEGTHKTNDPDPDRSLQ